MIILAFAIANILALHLIFRYLKLGLLDIRREHEETLEGVRFSAKEEILQTLSDRQMLYYEGIPVHVVEPATIHEMVDGAEILSVGEEGNELYYAKIGNGIILLDME